MTRDEFVKSLKALPGVTVSDADYKTRGFDLDVKVPAEKIVEAVRLVDEAGYFLDTMAGVDWLGEQETLRKEAAKAKAAAESSGDSGEAASSEAGKAAEEAPLPEDELEVVYDFNRFQERHGLVLRVRTPRSKPEVPTIQDIYPIAHWHEREVHEFFGIVFTGHPYLIPLLLPEDADYHPLLKDFKA